MNMFSQCVPSNIGCETYFMLPLSVSAHCYKPTWLPAYITVQQQICSLMRIINIDREDVNGSETEMLLLTTVQRVVFQSVIFYSQIR